MKGEKKVFSHFAETIGGQSSNVGVILQSVLWQLSKSSWYHQLKEDIIDVVLFSLPPCQLTNNSFIYLINSYHFLYIPSRNTYICQSVTVVDSYQHQPTQIFLNQFQLVRFSFLQLTNSFFSLHFLLFFSISVVWECYSM